MTVGEFWPEKYVLTNEWTLNYQQNAPMSLSGSSVSVDHGEPYWTAEVSVTVPTDSDFLRLWSSFFSRRKGRRNSFTMNRSFQSFPGNSAPVSPAEPPTIEQVSREAETIQLSGHGSYRATPGDMVGYFTAANGFYVGEIEAVTTNTAAQLLFEVTPPPLDPHQTTANMRFIKAAGEFRMDDIPRVTETNNRRSWNFSATQVIRG